MTTDPTMSIDELRALDVARERAADQAHLYLWATAGHLPEAFKVMAVVSREGIRTFLRSWTAAAESSGLRPPA